jgi:hypothetical protein
VAVAGKIEGVLDRVPVDRRHRQRGTARAVAAGNRRGVKLLYYGKEIGEELAAIYC